MDVENTFINILLTINVLIVTSKCTPLELSTCMYTYIHVLTYVYSEPPVCFSCEDDSTSAF